MSSKEVQTRFGIHFYCNVGTSVFLLLININETWVTAERGVLVWTLKTDRWMLQEPLLPKRNVSGTQVYLAFEELHDRQVFFSYQ